MSGTTPTDLLWYHQLSRQTGKLYELLKHLQSETKVQAGQFQAHLQEYNDLDIHNILPSLLHDISESKARSEALQQKLDQLTKIHDELDERITRMTSHNTALLEHNQVMQTQITWLQNQVEVQQRLLDESHRHDQKQQSYVLDTIRTTDRSPVRSLASSTASNVPSSPPFRPPSPCSKTPDLMSRRRKRSRFKDYKRAETPVSPSLTPSMPFLNGRETKKQIYFETPFSKAQTSIRQPDVPMDDDQTAEFEVVGEPHTVPHSKRHVLSERVAAWQEKIRSVNEEQVCQTFVVVGKPHTIPLKLQHHRDIGTGRNHH